MILYICFVITLFGLALFWKGQLKYKHLQKKFPYSAIHPIMKFVYEFPRRDGVLDFAADLIKKYGDDPVVCLYVNTYLIPTTPKLLEFVLKSTKLLDKGNDYFIYRDWFGNGLLTSKGQIWKNHRRILTPSFRTKMLEKYVKVFELKSFILVEKLRPYTGKKEVEIFDKITLFTLDVLCETAMGVQLNLQDNSKNGYVQDFKEMGSLIVNRLLTPLRNDLFFRISSSYSSYKRMFNRLLEFNANVVNNRKLALKNIEETSEVDQFGMKRKYTLLDALLKSKNNGQCLTDDEIREEVNTFMFAGHDTTSVAISFCLYLLSKHPDVQQKAYEEVVSVLGRKMNVETSYTELQEMKYLEQVINESLRLYPPVYVYSREINEDVIYEDTVLPKGLQIAISPFLIHRNPKFYPNPEKFDPERFSHEEMSKRHPYTYLPFSAGPRNCIGQKFAMLEFKFTIAKLLRYYRILPAIPEHTVQLICKITLASKNGIKIRLEERD